MAFITLNRKNLRHNYDYLCTLFAAHDIEWSIVAKVLCGNSVFLKEVMDLGITQICDSRITNLKVVKSITPDIETVFIKPSAKRYINSVVKYADVSFNTEFETIRLLSEEAQRQNKLHKIVIMIEMGELREGVMRDDFIAFYERVFQLPYIEVAGIGTNLTCMYGVLPSQDKLIQLCLYIQLIEAKFNKKIHYISGGSSVTIPLIQQGKLPKGINHFRVGETLFLGTNVYNNTPNEHLSQQVFSLFAEIIELSEKPTVPDGIFGRNMHGHQLTPDMTLTKSDTTFRAIIDMGLQDVEQTHIFPVDPALKVVGSSSDMMVVDLGENPKNLKVGDLIAFNLDYMGILRIMNCDYVEKRVV